MSWSEGYVSDVDYTQNYYRELCPEMTRLALLHRGLASAPLDRPRYLELGFGQGVSLNVHAAAGGGEYYGTDFSPSHTFRAQAMAEASAASVTLFDSSFAELLEADLPPMDAIVMHGVWSWISSENRAIIVQVLRKLLRPGGVVHLSYNVLPGWSQMLPIQNLLRLHSERAGSMGTSSVQRLQGAVDFLHALDGVGARYFRNNPIAQKRLASMKDKDPRYLAHEFLNEHWLAPTFAEVAEQLAGAKLTYAASAELSEHFDGLHLTPESQAALRSIPDLWLRETTRDFLVGQQFRRDLFVRGSLRLSPSELQEHTGALRFVLITEPSAVTLEVKGALGTAKLQDAVYRPVLDALAEGGVVAHSVRQLHDRVSQAGITAVQVLEALLLLTAKGDALPVQPDEIRDGARSRTARLNRHLLGTSRHSADVTHLASPLTGGGVVVSRIEQLFLLARSRERAAPAEWAKFAWGLLSEQGKRLLRDGKRLDDPEDNLREMERQATEFAEKRLPVLRALDVAED